MLLYAITDSVRQPGARAGVDRELIENCVKGWAAGGVDYIQLRQKEMDLAELVRLAASLSATLLGSRGSDPHRRPKLLVNSPASPEWIGRLAVLADGIHLPGRPRPEDAVLVREVFQTAGRRALVSVSCHSEEDVRIAHGERADLVVFAPVFEKPGVCPGQGLGALCSACEAAQGTPVFALGGVTAALAPACVAAGAAGVAGIRLFGGNGWRELVQARSKQADI